MVYRITVLFVINAPGYEIFHKGAVIRGEIFQVYQNNQEM